MNTKIRALGSLGALIAGDPRTHSMPTPNPRTSSVPLTPLLQLPDRRLQQTVCHPFNEVLPRPRVKPDHQSTWQAVAGRGAGSLSGVLG